MSNTVLLIISNLWSYTLHVETFDAHFRSIFLSMTKDTGHEMQTYLRNERYIYLQFNGLTRRIKKVTGKIEKSITSRSKGWVRIRGVI